MHECVLIFNMMTVVLIRHQITEGIGIATGMYCNTRLNLACCHSEFKLIIFSINYDGSCNT